jgi:hypothetical protein
MFLHEAWIDITKEKPPNTFNRWSNETGEGYSEHLDVLILTKRGDIFIDSPFYWNEEEFETLWGYENINGELQFRGEYTTNVENVTHWMLLDNLYKKGKA